MSKPQGKGLMGWLGRQIGYVAKAIKTDVSAKVVYRQQEVRETVHPGDPQLKLRRTVIDEVVKEATPKNLPAGDAQRRQP